MRPRKTVLVIAADEQELSLQALRVETWGYRVMRAETAKWALCVLERETAEIYAMMISLPLEGARGLMEMGRELRPEMRSLVLGDTRTWDGNLKADAFLPKGARSPAEVRERLKILTARKRGPRMVPMLEEKKPAGSVPGVIESLAAMEERRA